MTRLSRRQLLKVGAAGAAGAMAVPYFIPSGVLAADGKPAANERITVGAIGVGGRASLLAGATARRRTDRRPVRLQSAPGRGVQGQEEGRLARLPALPQSSWSAKTSTR